VALLPDARLLPDAEDAGKETMWPAWRASAGSLRTRLVAHRCTKIATNGASSAPRGEKAPRTGSGTCQYEAPGPDPRDEAVWLQPVS